MVESFDETLKEMQIHGMKIPNERVIIRVTDSLNVLKNAMTYFLSLQGVKYIHRKEYDEVAEWLSDNNGKGLLLFGGCGLGKTMLGRYAIPAILLKYCRKVVTCYDMNELDIGLDEALTKHIISLDDVGTETESVIFGKKREPFAELMDASEKYGKLVIITSNLDKVGLEKRYGTRVFDRVNTICHRVAFDGKSFRK